MKSNGEDKRQEDNEFHSVPWPKCKSALDEIKRHKFNMDQRKFCSQCSIMARYLGLTFVRFAQFNARHEYSSIFKLFLLLSDKRTIVLCPGPGLLLQDSRVQNKRVTWVDSVPIRLRTELLLTTLLQKCFVFH